MFQLIVIRVRGVDNLLHYGGDVFLGRFSCSRRVLFGFKAAVVQDHTQMMPPHVADACACRKARKLRRFDIDVPEIRTRRERAA